MGKDVLQAATAQKIGFHYTPVQLATVREADKARTKGRLKLERKNG